MKNHNRGDHGAGKAVKVAGSQEQRKSGAHRADTPAPGDRRAARKSAGGKKETYPAGRPDAWFEKHMHVVLYVSLLLTFFFGIFLFDIKISTGGDDSTYIEMANDFARGISYPSWHGPLYSVFLSLPLALFGVNVFILKIFSFAFIVAHQILFFFTFRKHVPPAVFSLIMLIVSVNSTLLYFASQTYSEAMYMFLQSLVILLFVNIYDTLEQERQKPGRQEVINWIILGFFTLLLSLTRNIGVVALAAMLFFLLIRRRYMAALMLAASFALFLVPYKIYKALAWNSPGSGGSSQFSEILLVNQYNRAEGYENLEGMVVRFFENARLYLSKHLMVGLGLRETGSTDTSWFITFLIAALLIIAFLYAGRKNKTIQFITIYLGASMAATFIALQQSWDQMRMVVIYIPMLLAVISWGLLQVAERKEYGVVRWLLVAMLAVIFVRTLGQTTEKMKANREILARNLKGDKYFGFSPDWQNFLRMSEWVGENIPDSANVASRKPSMSFIYSKGREFYGIYRLPAEVPSDLLNAIRAKEGELLAVPNSDLAKLDAYRQMTLRLHSAAIVSSGDSLYTVFPAGAPSSDIISDAAAAGDLRLMPADSLLKRTEAMPGTSYAVSPDTLVNLLIRNHVDYILDASLRVDPNANTGRIINTIQRYMFFIEQKYPGIISLVRQMGNDSNEPAWLFRINYDYYGLKNES